MATFWVMNLVTFRTASGPISLYPGDSIDDATDPVADILAAGGFLYPQGSPAVDLAVSAGYALRKKGVDTSVLTSAMFAAIVSQGSGTHFGNGETGVATFDGVKTFATFATKVGSVYALIRDVFLEDGSSVASGVTLNTAGFRLFCRGTLTNNGVIHCDGNAAVLGAAGAAQTAGTLGVGLAGGAGHVGVGAGTAGANQANMLQDVRAAGGLGGAGGAQAGGAGGTYAGGTAGNGGANYIVPMSTGVLWGQTSGGNQAQSTIIGGGAGGGGGGGGGGGIINSVSAFRTGSGVIITPGGVGGAGLGTGTAGANGTDGHAHLNAP